MKKILFLILLYLSLSNQLFAQCLETPAISINCVPNDFLVGRDFIIGGDAVIGGGLAVGSGSDSLIVFGTNGESWDGSEDGILKAIGAGSASNRTLEIRLDDEDGAELGDAIGALKMTGGYRREAFIATGGTITLENTKYTVFLQAFTANSIVKLPATPLDGMLYNIKCINTNSDTYTCSIDPNGKNVDGSSSIIFLADQEAVTLQYHFIWGWHKIGEYIP